MSQYLKARDEAMEAAKPRGWDRLTVPEQTTFISGFLGGWLASERYQEQEIEQQQAEIIRLKAKVNRLVEALDTEGVYQAEDRSDYLAERE